jgi:hypothetical protein
MIAFYLMDDKCIKVFTLIAKAPCMKSLFNVTDTSEIIERIEKLQPAGKALWGKMNVAQMLAHCQMPFGVFFGEAKQKRGLAGTLFGALAKRRMLHEGQFAKNLPTAKNFIIKGDRNFDEEKVKLIDYIKRFNSSADRHTTHKHPFFGKMSGNEWAVLTYKHLDHHLRQFNV